VLAHVHDPKSTLQLITRCVSSDGCALIQLTDNNCFFGRLTHRLVDLQRRIHQQSLHALNHTTLHGVSMEMEGAGFGLTACRRYLFVPGLRFVPEPLGRSVLELANRRPFADVGGEVLALFARTPTAS